MYMRVEWVAPTDNHATIDAYRILLIDSTGSYIEDTAACDGSAFVAGSLYCLIPMASLWVSPFTLPAATLFTAQVLAHNERGWSAASAANTAGASVETVPF